MGEEFEKPGWREGHTPNVQFVSQDLEEGTILTWPTLEPARRWIQQAGQDKEECKEGAKGRGDREREFPGCVWGSPCHQQTYHRRHMVCWVFGTLVSGFVAKPG